VSQVYLEDVPRPLGLLLLPGLGVQPLDVVRLHLQRGLHLCDLLLPNININPTLKIQPSTS